MKLNFTSNGRGRKLGLFRSVLDFFLPYPEYDKSGVAIIRHEAFVCSDSNGKTSREFSTFRAFALHYLYAPSYALKQFYSKQKREEVAKYWGVVPRLAYQVGAIAFDTAIDQ